MVTYNRKIRGTAVIYLRILRESLPLISLYMFNLLLCTMLAHILFRHTGLYPYTQLGDSLYEMLVMTTTSNFPDVILPLYQVYRPSCLLFVAYMVVNYMLLTNLLIAVFFNTYKAIYAEQARLAREQLQLQIQLEPQPQPVQEPGPAQGGVPAWMNSGWYHLAVGAFCLAQFLFYLTFHQDQLQYFELAIAGSNAGLFAEGLARLLLSARPRRRRWGLLLEVAIDLTLLLLSLLGLL
jgi:hypothetical protein